MPTLRNIHAANEFASLSQVSQDTRFVDFGLGDDLLPLVRNGVHITDYQTLW
jgi:hypothetical protein